MADNKWTYIVQPGDLNIINITKRLYGTDDPDLINYIYSNFYTYKGTPSERSINHIYVGDEIEIRDILNVFYKERTESYNYKKGEYKEFYTDELGVKRFKLYPPAVFYYKGHDGDRVASRRFLYCWKRDIPVDFKQDYFENEIAPEDSRIEKFYEVKNYFNSATGRPDTKYVLKKNEKELTDDELDELLEIFKNVKYDYWINLGILVTDDWGIPWDMARYRKKTFVLRGCYHPNRTEYYKRNYSEIDVKTHPDLEGQAHNMSQIFGFYNPNNMKAMKFHNYISDIADYFDSKEERYRKPIDERVSFQPGATYAFMFAPLDTIFGRDGFHEIDGGLKNYSPNGLSCPAKYFTDVDWDIEKLQERELAEIITIPQPENFDSLFPEGKKESPKTPLKHRAIKISLKPNIMEYVSLIKLYTDDLEDVLEQIELTKAPYHKITSSIGFITVITDLMKNFPKTKKRTKELVDFEKVFDDYEEKIKAEKNEDAKLWLRGERDKKLRKMTRDSMEDNKAFKKLSNLYSTLVESTENIDNKINDAIVNGTLKNNMETYVYDVNVNYFSPLY